MEGRQLGRYKLIEEIGQGGMAVVWRGVDTTLQREVAVKILHPHLSRKETNRQRFAREARVVATLHHDNIVEIYDFSGGEGSGAAGDAYIVTEYIRGRTLAAFLEASPRMPVEIAVLVVVEICDAIAHAHAQGVVHRDIKPENVMIREDGVLKLMDFGIARVNDESGATMTGTLMGSPQYMSPEQVAGSELDARSDLFSIGILLYRLVTGTLPFEAPNPASILRAILETTPVPPDQRNPLVGRALSAAIRKALAKTPGERHESVKALRDDLLASISDAGMGAPREEVKRYFADPEGVARSLVPQLASRYAAAGHARARNRDVAGAMELYSRVLEIDPANLEVREALDALSRGRRNGRVAVIALGSIAAAAVLGSAAAKGWQLWQTRPSPTPTMVAVVSPKPSATPLPSPSPTPTPTPRPSPSARPTARASVAPSGTPVAILAPSPLPSPAASPRPTETPLPAGMGALKLGMDGAADILIDGVVRGNVFADKNRDIVLAPGKHAIEIRPNPLEAEQGCVALTGEIEIVAGERNSGQIRTRRADGVAEMVSHVRENLYLRGCRVPFRLDLSDPDAVLKEVLLDGKPAWDAERKSYVAPQGDHHTVRVVAEGYPPVEIRDVAFRARLDGPQAVKVVLPSR